MLDTYSHCPKCGQYLDPNSSAGHHCWTFTPKNPKEGWICTRCGQSNAPSKMSCDCKRSYPFTYKGTL